LDSRPCSSQGQALRGNGEMGAWEWRSRLYSPDAHRVFARRGRGNGGEGDAGMADICHARTKPSSGARE
ncbi:MAG: hypothetical protein OXU61_02655, partial [Gammaproteobacteria bacterium]|nr:hypothetical protein [Gammaproteobacteria bacterium]